MPKYKKKPVVIEAIQWTGENTQEVVEFSRGKVRVPDSIYHLIVDTLEGSMTASRGDFIIRGIQGEYYPCKPNIFFETYDEVNDNG